MIQLLTQSVEKWAEQTPDNPAFSFAGKSFTYAQLWHRARQLAWVLKENGVQQGDRVGIYMDKCLESAVSVYGIMLAGAAFVPLDASAPKGRIQHMIAHCGIRALVTQPTKAGNVEQIFDGQRDPQCVVGIYNAGCNYKMIDWETVYTSPTQAPLLDLDEHDLAYIMYTSGSTGLPKGIMHTHYSGLSYARMAALTYELSSSDVLGNHSPLHFDMSTLEYFAGPFAGAKTVIIPDAYTKLPASLSKLIEDEKLTIWYSVPYALIQLLIRGVLNQRDTRSIRWVLYGGEPFQPKHLAALKEQWPQARFSNVYGPAEVNQCTFYHIPDEWPADESDLDKPVPIGSIWDCAEGMILDEYECQVEDGEIGELLVSTPTMMQGYWQQNELNRQAFFKHTSSNGTTKVFYRTGDLVVVNEKGLLDFIGRKDRQIKVRGYRVELDEVEKVLTSHPDVLEACAYSISPAPEIVQIEAVALIKDDKTISADDLMGYASGKLSAYAVPAKVEMTSVFPRTTSGKIDRKAVKEKAEQKLRIEAVQ